ncbi:IclR family transcriptional regulator [Pseudorhodoplanes sp.]|uniref:IclR family transcriptional regulator n=1 Tax=Pseudorhodoplanes sp. TaxID=1934341 RepID=UPI002D1DB722|nr:IclR family transcriptional regulator [Pseudorhodoplanes sp.]HWV55795.1 IclR family transcriptional regulator [Pseudorhodoplanes sp.]
MELPIPAADRIVPEAKDTSIISSFSKGLKVIDCILNAGGTVSVAEISQQLSMDKASAYRFLSTLERHGLARKDPRTRHYSLGPQFLVWTAKATEMNFDIISVAKPHLKELANSAGQEAHLAILSSNEALLIDTASPETPISVRSLVGVKEPLHCSALGKCLLAFQHEGEQARLLKALQLPSLTERTITDRAVLVAEIARIREQGYATDDREHIDVLTCVAAPVFSGDDVVASVGVSAISATVNAQDIRRLANITKTVARDFSTRYRCA